MRNHLAFLLAAVSASGASCGGLILPPAEPEVSVGEPEPDSAAPPSPPAAFAPGPIGMYRLTDVQYRNSIKDLLGSDLDVRFELPLDGQRLGFTAIGAASISVQGRDAEQYETAALNAARQVFATDARRTKLAGCMPAGPTDVACARRIIETLGRRVWRRPLRAGERDLFTTQAVDAARALGDFWAGVELAIAGMLQSPKFLFRAEIGEPDPGRPDRLRYTNHEIAARLSYALWNTTPDDALLDAADRGQLIASDGVATQVARLVASPRFRTTLVAHFQERFGLEQLKVLAKSTKIFPAAASSTLRASMAEESRRFIEAVVTSETLDDRDLLDDRQTFVNAELAKLYGLPAPVGTGFALYQHPANGPRRGLLGQAGVLAVHALLDATSPTLRGKFVRERLLCQEIPPPPASVNTSFPPDPPNVRRTRRQALEEHRKNPACAGCHTLMDPVGYGLENFDGIGAYRTTDNGLPIDPGGELDGRPFGNAGELAAALRDHPDLGRCTVRELYRQLLGHEETEGELPLLLSLEKGGRRLAPLVARIISSDGFRYAQKGQP